MTRKTVAVVAVGVTLSGVVSGGVAAASGPHVGPNQSFVGTLNGKAANAQLRVLCPGPTTHGHALANQPLEVLLVPPSSTGLGFTGTRATSIVADLVQNIALTHLATFTDYGMTVTFPTSLTVPCSGRATLNFIPAPSSPTSRPYNLTITFTNLGA